MSARKTHKGGARKRPCPSCPVWELATEAGELITAIDQVQARHTERRVGDDDLERAL